MSVPVNDIEMIQKKKNKTAIFSLYRYESDLDKWLVHLFKIVHVGDLKARFDIVNLFDEVYEIRDGSGIGVGAPQFGQRRGFYGGVSIVF